MQSLIPLLVPILSFFLQAYPRFFNKLFGVDVWTRLLETDHIRKNGHKIPHHKLSGQFIVDGYFDYPPVFPTLLSFVPKDKVIHIQGFVAPLFDALQVLLVFYVAQLITGDLWLAVTAQIIYMLTPMIALENSYLTPRSLGYLNLSLAVIPLLLYITTGTVWYFIVGMIFSALIFLTHRFATQSFLFISIFFTYYLNTPVFMQSLLLGFAVAMILTKGYYLRVLKGHFFNIYFWVKNLDFRFAHQVRGVVKKTSQNDWVGNVYNFLSVFSPIAVFGLNPWSVSGFVVIAAYYFGWFAVSPIMMMFAAWILFFYFFGVVVLKTKYLMPIGEGQRYMEMATVPSSILAAYIFFQWMQTSYRPWVIGLLVFGLLFNLALILFVQIKGVIKDKNRSVTNDWVKVFDFINAMKETPRIICVPHQNTTMTIYHTKAQVFVNADNPGLMRVTEVYPMLKLSLKELAEKYNLTHALVKESFVKMDEITLSDKDVVFTAGDVKLVKLA